MSRTSNNQMANETYNAFNAAMWRARSVGYSELGWVNATGPLEKMVEMVNLQGRETVIDIGTGSQAVLSALAPKITTGKIIGLDISADMLDHRNRSMRSLLVADAFKLPFASNLADIATARMVFHHLPQPQACIQEACRILKPEGKFLIGEYIATDHEVLQFERIVFDIKEPGRHLWTGQQLAELVSTVWPSARLEVGYGLLPQYSVRDWMSKSGLSEEIQEAVLKQYLSAPKSIIDKMRIAFTPDGDALVDRPFGFVAATK